MGKHKGRTFKCRICGEGVPYNKLQKHIGKHQSEQYHAGRRAREAEEQRRSSGLRHATGEETPDDAYTRMNRLPGSFESNQR
jgi:hypothetical protein